MKKNYSPFKHRRQALLKTIKDTHMGGRKKGLLLLIGAFEHEHDVFRQDSSFYYLTGIEEPALIMAAYLNGATSLFVPQYAESRTKWSLSEVYGVEQSQLKELGVDEVHFLGGLCKGYSLAPACALPLYENFLRVLEQFVFDGGTLFTLYPQDRYSESASVLDRLLVIKPELKKGIVDVSPIINSMRRTKTHAELEEMYKAVDCTMAAQEAVARIVEPEKYEYQVQAGAEFIFTESGARKAFPSIVASGPNSVTLHYNVNNRVMKKGELVVVDIGAQVNYYCADITRTFPVSGTFSKRQREVYTMVLDTQSYIESIAQPGYWLSNKDHPEKSLYHLAYKYLQERGYAQYFTHGIGHFLGIDVHDVGDYTEPLKPGDVITIEPGIYIPEENLGVRIEDDYWIVENGAVCLSEELPKESYKIEEMMLENFDEEQEA